MCFDIMRILDKKNYIFWPISEIWLVEIQEHTYAADFEQVATGASLSGCRRDCRSMAFPGSLHLETVLQNVGVSCIIFHVLFVKVLQ